MVASGRCVAAIAVRRLHEQRATGSKSTISPSGRPPARGGGNERTWRRGPAGITFSLRSLVDAVEWRRVGVGKSSKALSTRKLPPPARRQGQYLVQHCPRVGWLLQKNCLLPVQNMRSMGGRFEYCTKH